MGCNAWRQTSFEKDWRAETQARLVFQRLLQQRFKKLIEKNFGEVQKMNSSLQRKTKSKNVYRNQLHIETKRWFGLIEDKTVGGARKPKV